MDTLSGETTANTTLLDPFQKGIPERIHMVFRGFNRAPLDSKFLFHGNFDQFDKFGIPYVL